MITDNIHGTVRMGHRHPHDSKKATSSHFLIEMITKTTSQSKDQTQKSLHKMGATTNQPKTTKPHLILKSKYMYCIIFFFKHYT